MTSEATNVSDISAYSEFWDQIAELRDGDSEAFDYESPKGNRAARSYVRSLRQIKGAVERTRKAEKAASLEYGRKVDAEAKQITAELDAMIEIHAAEIRRIEEREAARVEGLRARLEALRLAASPVDEDGQAWGSNYLLSKLSEVRETAVDDSWEEFLGEAEKQKAASISTLERHVEAARKREKEAAELERLRQEREAREAREAEERAQREREAKEKAAAEAAIAKERAAAERKAREQKETAEREARLQREAHERALREAEEKAKREREESERRLREAEEAAARRELKLKLEAERKERERLAAEERERKQREIRERDEANRQRIHGEAAAALSSNIGLEKKAAASVVQAIATGAIPHVRITY